MIYDILFKAAHTKYADFLPPHAKETRQQFLRRLVAAISDIDDRDWENLPKNAQKWVTAGIDAINTRRDVPPIPGKDLDFLPESLSAPVSSSGEGLRAWRELKEEEEKQPLALPPPDTTIH